MENWREELHELQMTGYAPAIVFGLGDETGIYPPNNDALMITMTVANFDVAYILLIHEAQWISYIEIA